jgi:nitrite reductase/ring-hydroxylating ferredoxin subunit
MRKYFIPFLLFPIFISCSTNNITNNNPYLPNYPFTVELDLNLPTFSKLLFVSNAVYYPNVGVRGIYVFNTGSGYNAFDAACPNQTPSSCSTLIFKKLDPKDPLKIDYTNLICPCSGEEYFLFTGQSPEKKYPLKQYRVEVNGNLLRVYN